MNDTCYVVSANEELNKLVLSDKDGKLLGSLKVSTAQNWGDICPWYDYEKAKALRALLPDNADVLIYRRGNTWREISTKELEYFVSAEWSKYYDL